MKNACPYALSSPSIDVGREIITGQQERLAAAGTRINQDQFRHLFSPVSDMGVPRSRGSREGDGREADHLTSRVRVCRNWVKWVGGRLA